MGLYHFHNSSVKKAEVSLGIKELNLSLEERNRKSKRGGGRGGGVVKRNKILDDFSFHSLTRYVTFLSCKMKMSLNLSKPHFSHL